MKTAEDWLTDPSIKTRRTESDVVEWIEAIQADSKQSAYREIHARLPMPQYQSDPMTPREVKKLVDFIHAGMSNVQADLPPNGQPDFSKDVTGG